MGAWNLTARFLYVVLLGAAFALAGCRASEPTAVQDLAGREDLSLFKLHAIAGTRDGARLSTQAIFSDSSSILTIEMHFAVGSPTTLESGSWRWQRSGRLLNGPVSARSVTFLGGQDGPPSIGGTFDLLDASGAARYRVHLPVTALKTGWKG
jgi:hypothetical protein